MKIMTRSRRRRNGTTLGEVTAGLLLVGWCDIWGYLAYRAVAQALTATATWGAVLMALAAAVSAGICAVSLGVLGEILYQWGGPDGKEGTTGS